MRTSFLGTNSKPYFVETNRSIGSGLKADIRQHRNPQQISYQASKISRRITGDKQRLLLVLITRVREIRKRLSF